MDNTRTSAIDTRRSPLRIGGSQTTRAGISVVAGSRASGSTSSSVRTGASGCLLAAHSATASRSQFVRTSASTIAANGFPSRVDISESDTVQ
ncbi:Uncharacterised protein [Mycobacteroides abscessus subsp. abscessus]|nr:Uncharacterised protein [Mycobacteroides abscessus subsp. abscessus]